MEYLIGMTDYIEYIQEDKDIDVLKSYAMLNLIAYKNLLKQSLELWMFVPCDDDGNVLEEPDSIGVGNEFYYKRAINQFEEAKDRCLFEGFRIIKYRDKEYLSDGENSVYLKNYWTIKHETIEELIGQNLKLTETAKKQIGL